MAVNIDPETILAKITAAAMTGVANGAELVRTEAIRTMTQDPKTGRRYGKHRASAPGESPARETGRLTNSIDIIYDVDALRARVNFATKYAAGLEFGTERMAPRPFARPSLAAKKAEIEKGINEAVASVLS